MSGELLDWDDIYERLPAGDILPQRLIDDSYECVGFGGVKYRGIEVRGPLWWRERLVRHEDATKLANQKLSRAIYDASWKRKATRAAWYKTPKGKRYQRNNYLKRTYGVTIEQYELLGPCPCGGKGVTPDTSQGVLLCRACR